MVENAPILSCQHAGLTIEGYSRAAVQSYWRMPELKIGFDLGAQPWDFMGTPTWFMTHTHLDHVAALPVYVARRRMMSMEPPTIYVPAQAVEDVRRLLLDHAAAGPRPHGLRPATASSPATRSSCRAITSSPPSPRRTRFLRWATSSGSGATSSRRNTTACRATRSATCVCPACGDARGAHADPGLHRRHQPGRARQLIRRSIEAKILITELSFIRPNHRREKIHKFGHMHLDDYIERADRFQNELIICAHFSTALSSAGGQTSGRGQDAAAASGTNSAVVMSTTPRSAFLSEPRFSFGAAPRSKRSWVPPLTSCTAPKCPSCLTRC